MKATVAAVAALILAAPAFASSDQAWAENARAGRAACIKAANLLRPTVSAVVGFSDTVGRDAMLVRGTYPQRHMKGAKGTMLCLYRRSTRSAEAQEAKGWTAL
jgi:hypothetical protein